MNSHRQKHGSIVRFIRKVAGWLRCQKIDNDKPPKPKTIQTLKACKNEQFYAIILRIKSFSMNE